METRNIAVVSEHSRSNFSEIKGAVVELLKAIGPIKFELKEAKDRAFIEGRCASLVVGGRSIGVFGEIHPEVLSNFGLEEPVAAAELSLESVFESLGK